MARRSQQVFINCPFDRRYKPLFDAIVFTLHDLGYVALYALNKHSGGALRLPRIHSQLGNCAYSIHDLSRVSLSGPLRLPRFNMPFEAGVAYAMHAASLPRRRHELLLLDAKAHRYQASISDLAGLDPQNHNNDALKAIEAVRTFFAQHNPGKRFNVAPFIQRRYLTFSGQLPTKARGDAVLYAAATFVGLRTRSADHDGGLDTGEPVGVGEMPILDARNQRTGQVFQR